MDTCRALGCTQCFNISILTLNTFLTVFPIEMHLHVFKYNDIENNIWDQLLILALPSRILSTFLSANHIMNCLYTTLLYSCIGLVRILQMHRINQIPRINQMYIEEIIYRKKAPGGLMFKGSDSDKLIMVTLVKQN